MGATEDVDRQRRIDRTRRFGPPVLRARMLATLEAERAMRRGEEGAEWGYRQSLVDVAAAAAELAATLSPTSSRPSG